MNFSSTQELIEDLQEGNLLQFALPKGGRGFVKKNGDLWLLRGVKLKKIGYFVENYEGSIMGPGYHFVHKEGMFDIAEEIVNCDEEQAKDLLAFAIKLSYFFNEHPDYESSRDHDFDVLLKFKSLDKINTPLARAGFKVFS